MTGKLIKHEFKATSRIFLPFFGAVLILWGLSWIAVKLGGILVLPGGKGFGGPVFGILSGIVVGLTVFSLVALMLCAVFVTIQRFYKNILGDEGYLMLTLPVTPTQHLFVKLLAGTAWTMLATAVAVCVGYTLTESVPGVAVYVEDGVQISNPVITGGEEFIDVFGFPLWQAVLMLVILFLVGVVNTYLLGYLAMAIGGRWPQQRLGASIGAFAALHFVRETVYLLCVFVAGVAAHEKIASLAQTFQSQSLDYGLFFRCVLAIPTVVLLLESVLFFFLSRHLLTKRLNLA